MTKIFTTQKFKLIIYSIYKRTYTVLKKSKTQSTINLKKSSLTKQQRQG